MDIDIDDYDSDAAAVASELTRTDNPTVSFGEIRVSNQYMIGPDSEVLCDCDRCSASDIPNSMGRYELARNTDPVAFSIDEFQEFLLCDPEINPGDNAHEQAVAVADSDRSVDPQAHRVVVGTDGEAFDETADNPECASVPDMIDPARTADDYVTDALAAASGRPTTGQMPIRHSPTRSRCGWRRGLITRERSSGASVPTTRTETTLCQTTAASATTTKFLSGRCVRLLSPTASSPRGRRP